MKKLAIMFVPLILVLQMPLCPYRYLPQDWVNTYEYGKKWTSVLMSLYLDSLVRTDDQAKQPSTVSVHVKDHVMKTSFHERTERWHVETQVRILRFEIPAEQESLQFRTRCESL